MSQPTHVILGSTRFHAIDIEFTAALNDPKVLALCRQARRAELAEFRKPATERLEAWRIRREAEEALDGYGVNRGRAWLWYYVTRFLDPFEPGMSIPMCGMTGPGPAVPIGKAKAMGLSWSQECAKKLGLIPDDRHPLARCDSTGMRRAFLHTLDCVTCWHVGVGSCEIFALLAQRKIASDVDPLLEDLVA